MSAGFTIGDLASQTSISVPTIRYYEQIGLLPRALRAANGHRHYSAADLIRLGFIKRCRDFGFTIDQVRELVALFEDGDRACVEVRDMAEAHLHSLREKLEALRQLESSLVAFVASCDEACCKGPTRDCAIIEDLSAIVPMTKQLSNPACCASPSPRKKNK